MVLYWLVPSGIGPEHALSSCCRGYGNNSNPSPGQHYQGDMPEHTLWKTDRNIHSMYKISQTLREPAHAIQRDFFQH